MDNFHRSAALRLPLRLFLVLLSTTFACATAQQPSPPPSHTIQQAALPAGWKLFPTPTENSDEMRCANNAQQEQVSLSDSGTLQIVQLPRRAKPIPPPELPPGENSMPEMAAILSGSLHSVLKVQNGFLSGFDQGEWGGDLYFVDANGKSTQLYQGNVYGFVETSRGVMVFVGVAHLSLDSGEVLIAPYPITADTRLHHLAPLDGAPEALTKISPDEALVVTTHGISRITSSGAHQTLTHSNFGFLYPNSIVATPEDTIYAGMRLFVVRLLPTSKPGEYKEQWLVPESCQKFHQEGFTCACSK